MENQYLIKNAEVTHILKLIQGDITERETDAIVNAANSNLILGTGVAGAIRRKGGKSIQEECNQIGSCEVGGAVITTGGNLKTKHVIHAIGPIYQQYSSKNSELHLTNAIKNCLKVLQDNKLSSISFPAISTGIFGFPKLKAAEIMISTINKFLKTAISQLNVEICLFSMDDYKIFNNVAHSFLIN
ncbi:MAG: macro domain-containing protein [Promethearchaeota archaeon]